MLQSDIPVAWKMQNIEQSEIIFAALDCLWQRCCESIFYFCKDCQMDSESAWFIIVDVISAILYWIIQMSESNECFAVLMRVYIAEN